MERLSRFFGGLRRFTRPAFIVVFVLSLAANFWMGSVLWNHSIASYVGSAILKAEYGGAVLQMYRFEDGFTFINRGTELQVCGDLKKSDVAERVQLKYAWGEFEKKHEVILIPPEVSR